MLLPDGGSVITNSGLANGTPHRVVRLSATYDNRCAGSFLMRLAVSGLRRNRNPRRFGYWLEVCPAIPVLVIGGKSGRAVFGTTLAAAAVGFAWTSTRQFGEGLAAHRAPRCHEFVSYSSRIRGKNLPRWWDLRAIACRGCLTVVTRGRRWSESVAVFIGPWR